MIGPSSAVRAVLDFGGQASAKNCDQLLTVGVFSLSCFFPRLDAGDSVHLVDGHVCDGLLSGEAGGGCLETARVAVEVARSFVQSLTDDRKGVTPNPQVPTGADAVNMVG